ncbi:hypothetical protein P3T36_003837 [Kitasatospora sp. MAP12-15]|uniref:hypothetical protein n=1 Tax=unclassified Kitasatospora TaxID=2633591 RepID=UPI00247304BD|nr:hypothetical protein [Kitasatospora sp. MAP12-44]MDH6108519.1 hypothetical protein [Kitasatospora sp. MAP12-44]
MSTAAPRRVLILCQLDDYANRLKPLQVERFLRERGHQVVLADTYRLSRASTARGSLGARLPAPTPRRLALYATEAAGALLVGRWPTGRRFLSYYLLLADHRLRRAILRSALPLDAFDLVICEDPYDAGALTAVGSARTLYDCPTPWADELRYEGRLTVRQHHRLRRREAALFEQVDHLAFHWDSYARYAVTHYGISGRNLLTLNFGCTPSAERARFADRPRIVYLGSLGSRFIDLPLLSRLAERYPHIDVYGGPPPDPRLGLNYRGYARQPDVLREYQLGLVTCTQDELRRDGFSAKHLQYFAHGLPVLVPAWRRHLEELPGSVPYTESNFLSAVTALAEEPRWRRLSDLAYAQARRLAWDQTLRPLESLLADLPPRIR